MLLQRWEFGCIDRIIWRTRSIVDTCWPHWRPWLAYCARKKKLWIFTFTNLLKRVIIQQSKALISQAICFYNETHDICSDSRVDNVNRLRHPHLCMRCWKPDHRFKSSGSDWYRPSIPWVCSLDVSRLMPRTAFSRFIRVLPWKLSIAHIDRRYRFQQLKSKQAATGDALRNTSTFAKIALKEFLRPRCQKCTSAPCGPEQSQFWFWNEIVLGLDSLRRFVLEMLLVRVCILLIRFDFRVSAMSIHVMRSDGRSMMTKAELFKSTASQKSMLTCVFDWSKTMKSISKRESSESGKFMLRVTPWLWS